MECKAPQLPVCGVLHKLTVRMHPRWAETVASEGSAMPAVNLMRTVSRQGLTRVYGYQAVYSLAVAGVQVRKRNEAY